MSSDPVKVRIRDCECPGTPHAEEGDVVLLRPKPSVALGLAVEADIVAAAASSQLLQRAWAISYIRHGVIGWNLLDEKGKPVPLDVAILLDDWDLGMAVAEQADKLYGDRVVDPLLARLFGTLPTGSTDDSTSPPEESTPSPPEPSSPPATAATAPSTP